MQWIIGVVVAFCIRNAQTWNENQDWPAKKEAFKALIDAHLPAFFQPFADGAVEAVVDCFSLALKDTADLTKFATDLAQGNYVAAIADLQRLLQTVVHPMQPAVLAAVSSMEAHLVAAA